MKGDFSRLRFEPDKHYTSVLEQQGRVALDADWNEQRIIDEDIRQTEAIDIIGPFGGPDNDAGFAISISGNTIQIGAGRYYAHGLLCDNASPVAYGSQQYLIDPSIADSDLLAQLSAGKIGPIRVFLEVWRRMVTWREDPCLREPAIGQADTTTRVQTVWRVVAEPGSLVSPPSRTFSFSNRALATRAALAGPAISISGVNILSTGINFGGGANAPLPGAPVDCCVDMYTPPAPATPGRLAAQTTGGTSDCSCQPTPSAGFRGLENQLYRVEVHLSGGSGSATFKWSRENGSVVAAVLSIGGADVVVDSLGPDANLGFQSGQWVELSDDTYQFGPHPNQSGELFQIKSVNPATRTITLTSPVAKIDPMRNARLRRWEQSGSSATSNGVVLNAGPWIDLENGIQVRFADGQFQPGDYWLIPARTAIGQIEWPPCGSDGNLLQPPMRTDIIRAPLACIHFDKTFAVEDCRRLFPPLTDVAGGAASALHITKISWSNDDVIPFDQMLATGLTVSFDKAPTSHIDSSTFVFTLEPPVVSPIEFLAVLQSLTPIVLRTANPLDGKITAKGADVNWNLPYRDSNGAISGIQLDALVALNALLLQGINYASFARVRIRLMGSDIFAGTGSSQAFLDGQTFGTTGVRSDQVTPRTDLTFPSGDSSKASDFNSWFFLAPTLALVSLTIQPAAVTFAGAIPAPPVATLTVSYPALADTVVTLSVISPAGINQAVHPPATVTIPKGKPAITFNVPVSNTQNLTIQTFALVASLPNALGLTSSVRADLAITGAQIIF
jgi:Family of unknown function (DUF6519)